MSIKSKWALGNKWRVLFFKINIRIFLIIKDEIRFIMLRELVKKFIFICLY